MEDRGRINMSHTERKKEDVRSPATRISRPCVSPARQRWRFLAGAGASCTCAHGGGGSGFGDRYQPLGPRLRITATGKRQRTGESLGGIGRVMYRVFDEVVRGR